MKNRLLYSGVALTIIGVIGRLYAASYTYVDADNILRDSIWLPLGTLMFIAGIVLLTIFSVRTVINSMRKS